MLMSAFLLRLETNYLEEMLWLALFFFVDSNSPCKSLLFPPGPNLAQKPLYLVGTVLKYDQERSIVCDCTHEEKVIFLGFQNGCYGNQPHPFETLI